MNIEMIPLNKLVPSSANVRKTGTGIGIDELAASISAHGLLQNLQVRATPRGTFEVIAGGRRLAALKWLAKQKSIARDEPIGCNVLQDGEDATEISLAENVIRVDMHPADEFEAFKRLADAGKPVEDIAARYGVSALVVRQRLKLAAVSPALMQAYRDEEMTLEHLMAFTVSDDHAAQETAWRELPEWNRNARAIREHLTRAQVRDSDRRVRFVTLEAFQAAGGAIISDLFKEQNYVVDVALLDKLSAEKLETEAESVRGEGWKWVEIAPDADHTTLQGHQRQRGKPAPTAKQAKLIEKLETELEELSQKDDYTDEESERSYALDAQLTALREACLVFSDRQKKVGGAVVALDSEGALIVVRGLIAPADIKAAKHQVDDESESSATVAEDDTAVVGLSAKLADDLTAHRALALRAVLADQPTTALAAVVHNMAQAVFYDERLPETALDVRLVSPALRAQGIEDSRAGRHIEQQREAWLKRLPEDDAKLWDWLRQQDLQTLVDLSGFCAAQTVKAERSDAFTTLAGAVGLDMAQWWKPTAANYLGRISKAQIVEAVTEGAGAQAASKLDGLKKGDMAARAEELLNGKGWTPAIFR
jgi:ParB family transcriptional regulator, chromosome partitioning protein